jgi:hypothetical protein
VGDQWSEPSHVLHGCTPHNTRFVRQFDSTCVLDVSSVNFQWHFTIFTGCLRKYENIQLYPKLVEEKAFFIEV